MTINEPVVAAYVGRYTGKAVLRLGVTLELD